jgi:hypothetical protein
VTVAIGSGPCTWPDLTENCCDDWNDFSPELQLQALDFAKTIVWAATGRQFGLCELTVRPCGRQCNNGRDGYYYDGYGTWIPYIFNGVWRNCICGMNGPQCTCDPDCQVYLPGPVYSVEQVIVSGETLPVTGAYFVLDQQWLVRSDTTECWPMCGDQNVQPGTTEDLFQVTYTRGKPVPIALAHATSNYACEYARACLGLPCRLPGRISSIARQGVTISMVDPTELLRSGMTGLWELDQLILAINPYQLKGRTRLYSPDLQEPRQVTWY